MIQQTTNDLVCDNCLVKLIIPKLREDDIAVLQYLYNENINIPQIAIHKLVIAREINLSHFKTQMALVRLQCYSMVDIPSWSKSNSYYLKENAVNALKFLSKTMEG